MPPFVFSLVVAIVAALTGFATPAAAAPGDLDVSFGAFGKVNTAFSSSADDAYRVAIQPDGKIVVAGNCWSTTSDFCLARYTADGVLDTAFNGNGKVVTAIGSDGDYAHGMALQPDGKIVLAGVCAGPSRYDFCLARYTANGGLDATFNGTGKVITAATSTDSRIRSVALQADGKIVVAGQCLNATVYDFCVGRYLPNGTLDSSFNRDGRVSTAMGVGHSEITTALLQADGKILVTGYCYSGGYSRFCLARYQTNGALDTTFSSDGRVIATFGAVSANGDGGAVLQPDGQIVMSGACDDGAGVKFCVARFASNGTLDPTFGNAGHVLTTVGSGEAAARATALQVDGKIVVAGLCDGVASLDFCVVRYHGTGVLDTIFGAGGKLVTPMGSADDIAESVAIQEDGKIVAAGRCVAANGYPDFCLARYEGGPFGARNCSLDIDGDGRMTATIDALIMTRVMLGMTGSAVIAGITFPANAVRSVWGGNGSNDIRKYLITQCGLVLP